MAPSKKSAKQAMKQQKKTAAPAKRATKSAKKATNTAKQAKTAGKAVRKQKPAPAPCQAVKGSSKTPITQFGPVNTLLDRDETSREAFEGQAVRFPNYMQKSAVPGCGYGLFAGKHYKKGAFVERNPYMILRASDVRPGSWSHEALDCYWFNSSYRIPVPQNLKHTQLRKNRQQKTIPITDAGIVVMGPASFMNSSAKDQNVDHCDTCWNIHEQGRLMNFVATRDIRKGEELFIDYGKEWFRDNGIEDVY